MHAFYTVLALCWLVLLCRYLAGGGAVRRGGAYEAEFRRARRVVLDRDGHRCRQCGRRGTRANPLHVHHLVWRSRGGTNAPSNLVTLCAYHHRLRHR
jgi:hypothetical protein